MWSPLEDVLPPCNELLKRGCHGVCVGRFQMSEISARSDAISLTVDRSEVLLSCAGHPMQWEASGNALDVRTSIIPLPKCMKEKTPPCMRTTAMRRSKAWLDEAAPQTVDDQPKTHPPPGFPVKPGKYQRRNE